MRSLGNLSVSNVPYSQSFAANPYPQQSYPAKPPTTALRTASEVLPYTLNPPEPSNEDELAQEISNLHQELKEKQERLQMLQQTPPKEPEAYNRINKSQFDKIVLEEQRRERTGVLDQQMHEKEMFRQMEQEEKDNELAMRLDDLKRQREEQIQARTEQILKAKEYRDSCLLYTSPSPRDS